MLTSHQLVERDLSDGLRLSQLVDVTNDSLFSVFEQERIPQRIHLLYKEARLVLRVHLRVQGHSHEVGPVGDFVDFVELVLCLLATVDCQLFMDDVLLLLLDEVVANRVLGLRVEVRQVHLTICSLAHFFEVNFPKRSLVDVGKSVSNLIRSSHKLGDKFDVELLWQASNLLLFELEKCVFVLVTCLPVVHLVEDEVQKDKGANELLDVLVDALVPIME